MPAGNDDAFDIRIPVVMLPQFVTTNGNGTEEPRDTWALLAKVPPRNPVATPHGAPNRANSHHTKR